MEYCALGDLSLFIKRRDTLAGHRYTRDMIAKYPNPQGGALNEVVVRHFLKQLASALQFLRDRNLIHRDIKPQNLLLCPSPSSYRTGVANVVPYKGSENSYDPTTGLESLPMLKIADFGFARSLPATSLAETLCGSPLYMAPEILRYEKYDAKADLWSVGTVLYEMVVGRPPFRATNHVELLRRIEKGEDRIRFPEENPISDDIKRLIRGLLKRNPVERLNFPDFFSNPVIKEPIPGLVADDTPRESRRSSVDLNRSKGAYQVESRPAQPDYKAGRDPSYATDEEGPTTYPPRHRPTHRKSETPPSAAPMRRMGSADRPSSGAPREQPRGAPPAHRPSVVSHATAPGRQQLVDTNAADQQRTRNAYAGSARPGDIDRSRDERERAAQEVAFERDYVVVEKRAVEVNAFADELAHSPRIQGGFSRGQGGNVTRRSTTQGLPTLQSTSPHANSRAMQVVSNRARADSTHQRQSSYERRYGQSPTSATSAISKALNMATGRLFGKEFSPPMAVTKGGRSPPLAYNPFPAYPAPHTSLMLMGEGGPRTNAAVDEDGKTVQIIEACATRSDVVYGFAEVKYKQLIPLAPSAQADPTRPHGPGAEQDPNDSDDGLTVDAIVTLSEEALVLYVKALSLLAKSMDIAGSWWSRKNREDAYNDATHRGDSTSSPAGTRINYIVQWVRSRFNEVLEKAEFVRLKLIEGQRRLPLDHPNHPNNHSVGSTATSTGSADVVVSPGVTAEKLMYDRALEMSRTAAINELTSEDLAGCEIAYMTAISMLEAVLEGDGLRTGDQQGTGDKAGSIDLQGEDRQVVIKREFR